MKFYVIGNHLRVLEKKHFYSLFPNQIKMIRDDEIINSLKVFKNSIPIFEDKKIAIEYAQDIAIQDAGTTINFGLSRSYPVIEVEISDPNLIINHPKDITSSVANHEINEEELKTTTLENIKAIYAYYYTVGDTTHKCKFEKALEINELKQDAHQRYLAKFNNR